MTEVLLQQLEEKMMARLSELEIQRRETENMRRELDATRNENTMLKVEREKLEERVKGIISLLETVNVPEANAQMAGGMAKPMLVQA